MLANEVLRYPAIADLLPENLAILRLGRRGRGLAEDLTRLDRRLSFPRIARQFGRRFGSGFDLLGTLKDLALLRDHVGNRARDHRGVL